MDTSSTSVASALPGLTPEEQSNHANMDKHMRRFGHTFTEVNKRITAIESCTQVRNQSGESEEAASLMQSSYLHLLELKAISRALANLGELTKTQLQARKKRLDAVNLQYESILYEKTHLQKEIAIARDFKSKYPPLDLVSESDFLSGSGLGGSGVTPVLPADITPHQLHLARLRDELDRRSRLQGVQRDAEKRDADLQAENDALRARAAAFLTQVKASELHNRALVSSLWPEQTALHVSPSTDEVTLLPLLSSPLYTLFFAASSFAKGQGLAPELFRVTIRGNAAEAQAANKTLAAKAAALPTQANSWTATLETLASESSSSASSAAAAAAAAPTAATPAELAQFVQRHPLSLQLHLRSPTSAAPLTLNFAYHLQLKLVSVEVEGGAAAATTSTSLANLFSGDSGSQLPLDASAYPARLATAVQAGLASAGEQQPSPLGGTARPYRWAQSIAGIYVLPPTQQNEDDSGATSVTFRAFIDKLAARVAAKPT